MKKRLLSILLTIMLFFVSGCSVLTPASSLPTKFLQCIARREFSDAYQYLSAAAQQTCSEEDFIQRYEVIFQELDVQSISYSDPQQTEEGVYQYTLLYGTGIAGTISCDITMSTTADSDDHKINWTPALLFPEMDWDDTLRIITLHPSRGEIFAGDSELLAGNSHLLCVYVRPSQCDSLASTASSLSPLLDLKAHDILQKLESDAAERDDLIVIKSFNYNQGPSDDLAASLTAIPGVHLDHTTYYPARTYELEQQSAHLTGYVGKISDEEFEAYQSEGYSIGDSIGKEGLEKHYEAQLKGEKGKEIFIRSPEGKNKKTLYRQEATNGLDLRLTIDSQLQKKAYAAFEEYLTEGQTGVAIVMDYKTGAVSVIANYPSYNPNEFVDGVSEEYWNELMDEDNNSPLFNRATQSTLPPGSIMKLITAVAGLETNTITAHTTYSLNIVNNLWTPSGVGWVYPAIRRSDAPPHALDLRDSMVWSDNIYFAKLAIDLGEETLVPYFEKFGIGEAIPFEMPVKSSQYLNQDSAFNVKLVADSGFGQGELLFSPLQLASTVCAFANGGHIPVPYVVSSLTQDNGRSYEAVEETQPSLWKENVIDPSTLQTLTPMLEQVMTNGTGRSLRVDGVTIAGKTGTGRGGDNKELGWFAGWWEDGDENRLALVLVEGSQETTGSSKFNIARALLQPDTAADTDDTDDTADIGNTD
ncbi:MAG: penicillin-binding transpeptidase domain-containing protein [Christensenellales bacterium]